MLLLDQNRIIESCNDVCRAALDRAASRCWKSGHYELTVEHLLTALLEAPESDMGSVFRALGVDIAALLALVQREIEGKRATNSGRPVASPLLLQWLQDGFTVAAATFGEPRIRSGALLARLVASPREYTALALVPLESIPKEDVRTRLPALCAGSAEGSCAPSTATTKGGGAPTGDAGALARFAVNLTARAQAGALDPVIGRENEVRQVLDVLCRRRKNNPLLVGEAGVGKTAVVEGLALRIASGNVPEAIRGVQLWSLDLGSLQAGASVSGEYQKRLKAVLDEVKGASEPTVLFIDEAHMLIGAGGPQGGGDAANLLKPALARGEVRTIAATTWAEYKRYFERDAALARRFERVQVGEPTSEGAVDMLRGVVERFERAHGVLIRDGALRAAVALSSRYLPGRQLPDKAVDLIDSAAARVRLSRALPGPLEDARAELAASGRELEAHSREAKRASASVDCAPAQHAYRRHLAAKDRVDTLGRAFEQQLGVVTQLERAQRDGTGTTNTPASGADLAGVRPEDVLVHGEVDEALVARVVADWTGIPVGKMMADDRRTLLELEDRLSARVRAQEPAVQVLSEELRTARAGLKAPGAPLGVFLLVGPSGVGKTETAIALADLLFGGERSLIKIDMGEFGERHTVSRLIGSPPGYVGYGEGGKLTEAVRKRPYSVVLLDEVEKAHPDVMNLFYGVFEKGVLRDGEDREVHFENTVVVMTSNLGAEEIIGNGDPRATLDGLRALVRPALKGFFRPALLGRMTVVPYLPIAQEALEGIVHMKLDALAQRAIDAHGTRLRFDEGVAGLIAARCTEVESGARNIDAILRARVLPLVSNALLRGLESASPPESLRVIVGPAQELLVQ